MFHKQMKPETIERRRQEQAANDARRRELFLVTYAQVRAIAPIPTEPPSGSRYSATLADGREVIISADRYTIF